MKQMVKNVCILIALLILAQVASGRTAQSLTQTIRGVVTDKASGEPLPYATVELDRSGTGTVTDENGAFTLTGVPIGRHSLAVNFMGYETSLVKEILVTSAKEVYLEITLVEKPLEMSEVIVTPKINKAESLNKTALLGAQMFSVEEASRFAGGMDDPARLVSSYAGVAAAVGSSNSISIHGNAPNLLQWRVEDVEISNPNHFAEVNGLGGGFLSALSSNVLANSDFFIGAFPAEYNNAISGVFDMKLRNGNNQKYQHTFQLGMLGIDFASEGPISKKHQSSYIINYRYSTTSLLEKLRKEDMGGTLKYQDLNFKFNFPTPKAGVFSFWGTGLIDEAGPSVEDVSKWDYKDDGISSNADQKTGATGITHRYFFGNRKTSLKTTLAATYMGFEIDEDIYDEQGNVSPNTYLDTKTTNLVLTSALNHKFSNRHTNKTGFTVTNIDYDMRLDHAPLIGSPIVNINDGSGNTSLLAAYTNSVVSIGNSLTLTLGLNGQFFTLNNQKTIEPRAGLKWQASSKSSFAVGYGLHSRMEKPDVYFVKDSAGLLPNKELSFIKSHHFMLSYTYRISENMNLKLEPYYQPLYDVPVIEGSAISILNRNNYYVTDTYVNKGKGYNYGVDLTFEKYMTRGLYYMITASVFDSKYKGGDGCWYDTKYSRKYIVNGLIGKEWMLKRDIFSMNLRATLMGGQRYTPVDEAETLAHPDKVVQYDETRMYSEQFSPMFITNFSISYKMNRKKVAHEFALKGINANGQKEYIEHRYNIKTNTIEAYKRANYLFNISYRLEF